MLVRGRWDMLRVLVGTTLIIAAIGVEARAVEMAPLCAPPCQAGGAKKWLVKFAGAKVELVITGQSVLFKTGEETVLEIPAAGISEVGYDTSSHNLGRPYLKDAGAAVGAGEGIIAAPFFLASAAILLPSNPRNTLCGSSGRTKGVTWRFTSESGSKITTLSWMSFKDCRESPGLICQRRERSLLVRSNRLRTVVCRWR